MRRAALFARRVPPFGHLRIKAHVPLPGAFRSLSRPSSPARAKASPACPPSLSFFLPPAALTAAPLNKGKGPQRRRALVLFCSSCFHHVNDLFVENNGFEPLTLCLQSRCSSQLS